MNIDTGEVRDLRDLTADILRAKVLCEANDTECGKPEEVRRG